MSEPWQLKMFGKTLKKQQKLALLLSQIGSAEGLDCLLITNGDNNGALNYRLRDCGGKWTWVENEADHLGEMEELLEEPVLKGSESVVPVGDSSFDLVVTIDVHEHLGDCKRFNQELKRVTRPGGRVVVTTPSGDLRKPVTILKDLIGMRKEAYGHSVVGYTIEEHQKMLKAVGLDPIASGSYSRFFTEMLELGINFAYVKVLSRRKGVSRGKGVIAPSSASDLKSLAKQYKLYSTAYPVLRAVSMLDALLFFTTGYAVSVVALKPS